MRLTVKADLPDFSEETSPPGGLEDESTSALISRIVSQLREAHQTTQGRGERGGASSASGSGRTARAATATQPAESGGGQSTEPPARDEVLDSPVLRRLRERREQMRLQREIIEEEQKTLRARSRRFEPARIGQARYKRLIEEGKSREEASALVRAELERAEAAYRKRLENGEDPDSAFAATFGLIRDQATPPGRPRRRGGGQTPRQAPATQDATTLGRAVARLFPRPAVGARTAGAVMRPSAPLGGGFQTDDVLGRLPF